MPTRFARLPGTYDQRPSFDPSTSSQGTELTINHIKDHHDWVAGLTRVLAEEGDSLKRKFRMSMAKRNTTKDAKRTLIIRAPSPATLAAGAAAYDKRASAIYKLQ